MKNVIFGLNVGIGTTGMITWKIGMKIFGIGLGIGVTGISIIGMIGGVIVMIISGKNITNVRKITILGLVVLTGVQAGKRNGLISLIVGGVRDIIIGVAIIEGVIVIDILTKNSLIIE